MKIREYNFDFNESNETIKNILKMHIETMIEFRNTTPNPDELEWEIRVYEFMLNDTDSMARYKEYQYTRYAEFPKKLPLEKRETIKKLGWNIP